MLSFVGHDTRLLVLSYSLLKEIGFPLEGNVLHEVKWVLNIVDLQKEMQIMSYTVTDKLALKNWHSKYLAVRRYL